MLRKGAEQVYHQLVNPAYLIRRVQITAVNISDSQNLPKEMYEQTDLFSSPKKQEALEKQILQEEEREKKAQETILTIKKKYGKNAAVRGTDFESGATGRERNNQIGGHKA
jgi:DNA polymerase V